MVWALYPDLTALDLKAVLRNSASKISDITSQIDTTDGRLDLKAALTYAAALKKDGKTPAEEAPAAGVVLAGGRIEVPVALDGYASRVLVVR